jgi:hypothetical protein
MNIFLYMIRGYYYKGFTFPLAINLAIASSLIESSISEVISFLILFDYLLSLPLFLIFIIIIYPDADSFAINWLIIFCC